MTKLSRDDILKLARLARLHLDDAQVQKFQVELSEILEYVAQLDSVDTTGVEPTYQVTGLTNVMRDDEPVDYGVSREELLKNVPALQAGHIKVKRMIG